MMIHTLNYFKAFIFCNDTLDINSPQNLHIWTDFPALLMFLEHSIELCQEAD